MDEAKDSPSTQLVSSGSSQRPARPVFEFVLCALASLGSVLSPSLGCALMVFGAWRLAQSGEGRAVWAALGCLAPGIVLSFATWDYASLVLPCSLCALAIAFVLSQGVSVGKVVILVALLCGMLIGVDASLLMLQGESFAAYVQALLDELAQVMTASLTTGTSSVSVQATVDSTVGLLGWIWPLIYAMRAACTVCFGLVGLEVARRDSFQKVHEAFKRCDVPLWIVALFIASVACLAGWSVFGVLPEVVGVVALNVFICMRVVFFLQGCAVMLSLMDSHGWGFFPRVLLLSVAFIAEVSLSAVCILGLVDVWADFRKLASRDQDRRLTSGEGK